MELEQLKNKWEVIDKKLSKNLKFNDKLIKKINFDKSKNEMQKLILIELINVIGISIALIFFSAYAIRLIDDLQYSVTGFIGSLILLAYISFSIMKIRNLLRIDYYNSSVVDLQKELSKTKVLLLRIKRVEYLLIPFLMVSLLPITFISVGHTDIYEHLDKLWLQLLLIFGFVVTIILVFLANKYLYDSRIQNAEDFLKEIGQFENAK